MMVKKYNEEYSFPIFSKGCSTVLAPIQVRIKRIESRVHSFVFFRILNFVDFDFFVMNMIMIRMEEARARTPPNFDGRERSTTYINRKYHSGWICSGAINGLAVLKFSISLRMFGVCETIIAIRVMIRMIIVLSLSENKGLNLILSIWGLEFVGLEDPLS